MRKSPKKKARKASTLDVVGAVIEKDAVPRKWKQQYHWLTELREHLRQRRANLSKDALSEQPGFSTHMADAGTDEYDRDLSLSFRSSEQDALYEIEQALDRIRNGTYGICELTGKPIGAKRLEALPWTR